MKKHHKLIILGSGFAGYTAAIYAARANLKPTLISESLEGSQIISSKNVENWPGTYQKTSGIKLINSLYKQTKKFKTKIIEDYIFKVNFKNKPFSLFGYKKKYTFNSLIIATGSSPKFLGIKSEKKFLGKGISTCAICDGFFYKKKKIAIIGGGNCAIENALYLSNIVSKIYLVHRRKKFKAEPILIKKLMNCKNKKNIIFYTEYTLKKILGNNNIEKIIIQKNNNSKIQKNIKISGIFISIGNHPNTKIFNKSLNLKNNYIKVKTGTSGNFTQTSIPGIFAAGDVIDPYYKQAVIASSSGCMAALDAKNFLEYYQN